MTEEYKTTVVDLHNQYRAQVSPPGKDMTRMTWDDQLKTSADSFAMYGNKLSAVGLQLFPVY